MADGLLGKCKECTKRDTAARHSALSQNPDWTIAERARHRAKSRRYRAEGKETPEDSESVRMRNELYSARNPEKRKAHYAVGNAIRAGKLVRIPCEVCGNPKSQAHHEDYSRHLDVTWLCATHHAEHHVLQRDRAILDAAKEKLEKSFKSALSRIQEKEAQQAK